MQKVLLFLPIFILGIACSPKNISPITKIAPDDYWEYYEMVNTAKDFRDAENYQESANTFLNAFKSVKRPLSTDLRKMMFVHNKLGNEDQVKFYAKQLAEIYGSYPSAILLEDEKLVNKLKIELKPIVEKTQNSFDTTYLNVLQKLVEKDKSIRKTGKTIYPNGVNIDSINTYKLLDEIKQRGFPSKERVGYRGYRNGFTIFLHADFDIENELLGDFLLKAVGRGEMSAGNYAEIIDRRCNYKNMPFRYHQVPFGYDDLSDDEKATIRAARKKIGLRSIEKSLKIITFPNGDVSTMMLD